MTTHTSAQPPRISRPGSLWLVSGLLGVLAVLSAIGGYLFNLSGADDTSDYVVGSAFLVVAAAYLACAFAIPRGGRAWRSTAIALAVAHGLFNAVVKVGIEGELVSLMFVALTALVVVLLTRPVARGFFAAA